MIGSKTLSKVNPRYLVLLAAISWSTGGLVKVINLNAMVIAGFRCAITAAAMLIFFAVIRRRPQFSGVIVGGAIAYAIASLAFIYANQLTVAANAIALQAIAPVWIPFISIFWLKDEKIKPKDCIVVISVLSGIALLTFGSFEKGSLLGNLCALISGHAYAWEIICLRKQKNAEPLWNVLWGNILLAFIAIPCTCFNSFVMPDTKNMLWIIFLGLIQSGLSYFMFSNAIKRISALEGGLLTILEVVLNPFWVYLTIGEIPNQLALIGCSIIVLSLIANCSLNAISENKQPIEHRVQLNKIPINILFKKF